MNENRVPTCGSVISSMNYDVRLRRHQWFMRNKIKLAIGSFGLLVALATIAVIALI